MPVFRAPKKRSVKKTVKANKKSAAKKSATVSRFAPIRTIAKPAVKAKPKKKVAKKAVTPRRFLTKAELEELKKKGALATEAPKGPRRFPTKAELEAMKAAKNPQSAATAKVPGATKKVIVDGEEVEVEDVELEDLESIATEGEGEEGEEKSDVRVVNLSEEAKREEGEFTLKDSEEDDAPPQTVLTAGATADPVKDYL